MKPHRGTLILVFGVLSLVVCMPLGIAAWIMGKSDLREMDEGKMDPSGRGETNAGRICGMISVGLAGLGILIVVFFVAIGMFFSLTNPRVQATRESLQKYENDKKWQTQPTSNPSPQPDQQPKEIKN